MHTPFLLLSFCLAARALCPCSAIAQTDPPLNVGYVGDPTAYAQYDVVRDAFAKAMGEQKINWQAYDTQADLSSAVSQGKIAIALGQDWKQLMLSAKQPSGVSPIGIASQDFDSGTCFLPQAERQMIQNNPTAKVTVGLPEDKATWPVYFMQLEAVGLDTANIDVVEIKPGEALPAIASSRISIGCGWESDMAREKRPSDIVELMPKQARDEIGATDTFLITANNVFAADNPQTLTKFLTADDEAKKLFKSDYMSLIKGAGYSGPYYASILSNTKFPSIDEQLQWNAKDPSGMWTEYAHQLDPTTAAPKGFSIKNEFLVPTNDGKRRGVEILYATDREPVLGTTQVSFGSGRSRQTSYGTVTVTVPLNHRRGMLERPWEVDLFGLWKISGPEYAADHFTIAGNVSLTEQELLDKAGARAGKATAFHNQIFVFVHGFKTDFDTAAFRTAQIVYDMKFDGAPILYSWPSGGEAADYVGDRDASEISALYLADFLTDLFAGAPSATVNVICHSMGCNTTGRAIERIRAAAKPSTPPYPPQLNDVVFAAPDVDRGLFVQWLDAMGKLPRNMTLYASSADKALALSKAAASNFSRAGDVPNEGPIVASNIDSIDVTALGDDIFGLNHDTYVDSPVLMNDIAMSFLHRDMAPPQRFPGVSELINGSGQRYWKY